jgi:hypothetical protein
MQTAGARLSRSSRKYVERSADVPEKISGFNS